MHRVFVSSCRLLGGPPGQRALAVGRSIVPTCRLHTSRLRLENEGMFGKIVSQVKNELKRNKQLKESLKKFQEDKERLDKSETVQQLRKKYQAMEEDLGEGHLKARQAVKESFEKLGESVAELQKSEYLKKASEDLGKIGSKVSQTVTESSDYVSKTRAYKTISGGIGAVKEEYKEEVEISRNKVYRKPKQLKKRQDLAAFTSQRANEPMEENTETKDVTLHRDSKWYESWQNWKATNPYIGKVFDLRTRYQESDHVLLRLSRGLTERLVSTFGRLSQSDISEVLTEILKMDPAFTKEDFVVQCQTEIIPHVLEAWCSGNLDVLRDCRLMEAKTELADDVSAGTDSDLIFADCQRIVLELTGVVDQVRQGGGCSHATLMQLNETARKKMHQARKLQLDYSRFARELEEPDQRERAQRKLDVFVQQLSAIQLQLREANVKAELSINDLDKTALLQKRRQRKQISDRRGDETDDGASVESREQSAAKATEITQSLLRISQLLSSGVARALDTVEVQQQQTADIATTGREFSSIGGHIHTSRALLSKFQRRQFTDKMLIIAVLIFFFSCVLFVLQQRLMPKFWPFS